MDANDKGSMIMDWDRERMMQHAKDAVKGKGRLPLCNVPESAGSAYCMLEKGHSGKHRGMDVEGSIAEWGEIKR